MIVGMVVVIVNVLNLCSDMRVIMLMVVVW